MKRFYVCAMVMFLCILSLPGFTRAQNNRSISGTFFVDNDKDGTLNDGDELLKNKTVELYKTGSSGYVFVKDTNTNGSGRYTFLGLERADNYCVKFIIPNNMQNGYEFVLVPVGEDPGLGNSFIRNSQGYTGPLNVSSSSIDDINGALKLKESGGGGGNPNGQIRGIVWLDADRNGTQGNVNEPGLNGWTVNLYRIVNGVKEGSYYKTTDTKTSNADGQVGRYEFTELPSGDYCVEVVLKSGYSFTSQYVGNDQKDSDVNQNTGISGTITVEDNAKEEHIDAGVCELLGTISGHVWNDTDMDGERDDDEPRMVEKNVTLQMPGHAGIIVKTNTEGYYIFNDVPAGNGYKIQFTLEPDYLYTGKDKAGVTEEFDSDANTSSGQTDEFDVAAGQNKTFVDAGMYNQAPPASNGKISGKLWDDSFLQDGLQGNGNDEPGIGGCTVELYAYPMLPGASYLQQMTTATSGQIGSYKFEGLSAGDYIVKFSKPANTSDYNFEFTSQNAPGGTNTNDGTDSDAGSDGFTGQITLAQSGNINDVDAGVFKTPTKGTIRITAWQDDGDGMMATDETKVEGVSFVITNCDGSTVNISEATPPGGIKDITGLNPGSYKVTFTLKQGFDHFSLTGEGKDNHAGQDGLTTCLTLLAGSTLSFNAGMVVQAPPVSNGKISGKLWDDSFLHDGLQGNTSDEPGIDGYTVELYAYPMLPGASYLQQTTTGTGGGPAGSYKFEGLSAGDYIVKFSKPANTSDYNYEFTSKDAPNGTNSNDGTDSDAGSDGFTGQITLAQSENKNDVDAGVFKTSTKGTIRITAWEDDGDGLIGINENMLKDVQFVLTNCGDNTEVTSDITDNDGTKVISGLNPGSYKVTFTLKSGFDNFSPTGDGKDNHAGQDGITTCLTLLAGGTLNINAGMVKQEIPGGNPNGQVNGIVWLDADRDGFQLGVPTEPGLEDWTVNLYKVINGQKESTPYRTIQTETSNAEGRKGRYEFTKLPEGYYCIEVILKTGYSFTVQYAPPSDQRDSDVDPNTGISGTFYVGDNAKQEHRDAGVYLKDQPPVEKAKISGILWDDTFEHNGLQGVNSEPGIPAQTVELYIPDGYLEGFTGDFLLMSTTTKTGAPGVKGTYEFLNVPKGTYFVKFKTLPEGYTFTFQNADNDDQKDSDVDPATGKTINFTVNPNDNITHLDAGAYKASAPKGSIGDLVWYDKNCNGIQDHSEQGVPGVSVMLYSYNEFGHHGYMQETHTGPNGNYSFTGLVAGTYIIHFIRPFDFDRFTVKDADFNHHDTEDSDADHDGWTGPITLTEGEIDNSVDAGLCKTIREKADIGDFVWKDINCNGIQDYGEPGIPNVMVQLFKWGENVPIMSAITDAYGHYLFKDLEPGDYYVKFQLPEGFTFTKKDQGFDDALDSDADRQTGVTGRITLEGHDDLTIDAGMYGNDCMPVSIGDFVWNDLNKNGIQNSGEPGLSHITVNLFKAGKTTVHRTTFTDKYGFYHFAGLLPGTYSVQFILPQGFSFTLMNQGSNDALDSDADMSTGMTGPYNLASGEANNTIDAGMFEGQCMLANLGDFVWNDCNKNGIQDVGETGIGGVEVKLHTCTSSHTNPSDPCTCGDVVASTKTDKNGKYMFTNIMPGYYCVEIVVPCNFTITKPDQAEDFKDSDVIPSLKHTACIRINPGQTDLTVDAGLYPTPPATIGDFVWIDANKNGIQNDGEKGLCNVNVELYMCGVNKAVASTTTDNNGKYIFKNVTPNTSYSVKFYLPKGYTFTALDQGSNDNFDSDVCPKSNGMTRFYDILPDETNLTIDCGMFLATASPCNYVWKDINNNGLKDNSEEGIPGVPVELYRCSDNTLVQSAKTDQSGLFAFKDLLLETYYLKILVPDGYKMGTASKQSGTGNLSADFGTDGQSSCFELTDTARFIGSPVALVSSTTGIRRGSEIPTEFALQQNYPNPFNPSTTIEFAVPAAGQYTLKVFNMLGEEIATLLERELPVGYHMVIFDASKLTSGMYIYRLSGSDVVIVKKMMLSK